MIEFQNGISSATHNYFCLSIMFGSRRENEPKREKICLLPVWRLFSDLPVMQTCRRKRELSGSSVKKGRKKARETPRHLLCQMAAFFVFGSGKQAITNKPGHRQPSPYAFLRRYRQQKTPALSTFNLQIQYHVFSSLSRKVFLCFMEFSGRIKKQLPS